MRGILFKGLTLEGNEWIESHNLLRDKFHIFFGAVPYYNLEDELCLDHYKEIIPETLFQYTGVDTKKSVKVFEGDIFKIKGKNYVVEYLDDRCCFVLTTRNGYDTRNCLDLTCDAIYYEEIIGNIYEDKELVKII